MKKAAKTPCKLSPPVKLDAATLRHWESLVNHIDATGDLAEADEGIILATASTFALFERVKAELAASDLVDIKLCAVYSGLLGKLTRLLRELRLTPATRVKGNDSDEDPLQKFLQT
jgi:phage terminase small subunit